MRKWDKLRFEIGKKGLVGFGKQLLFGEKKPDKIEIAGDKTEIRMGWIQNDYQTYLFEDQQLNFAGTDNFGQAFDMYRDMLHKWPHFRHLIQKRKHGVLSKVLNINAGSDDERDVQIAQFCKEMIDNIIEFRQDLEELLECLAFGFSISEIMYEMKNGKWVIKELKNRQQERFRFRVDQQWGLDMDGTRASFAPIDLYKFVIAQYNKEFEKPYGRGECRYNYWYYWFLQNGLKFYAIFLDKYGSPTAMGKYPSGTSQEDQDELLKALDAIQTSQSIKIPDNVMIELLEAKRTGTIDCYEKFIRYLEMSVSKNVLGGMLTSDEGRSGTYAQSKVHDTAREEIIRSDCFLLEGIIRDQIIRPVVLFNFGADTNLPEVKFDLEEPEDLESRAKTDEILVTKLGVPLGRDYFYQTYQRPEPEEESLKSEVGSLKKEEKEREDGKEEEVGSLKFEVRSEEKKGEGGSLKFEGGSEKEEVGSLKFEGGSEEEKGVLRFAERGEIEKAKELYGRWRLDEDRYFNNAIDGGKRFYFSLMDWIKKGLETAEDEIEIYNLGSDPAEAETTALENFLTSMIFTAQLNGMWQVAKLADDEEIVLFQEEGIGEFVFSPMEPTEAIEYFENLIPMTREEFNRNLEDVRGLAFTAADIQRRDVIAKLQDSLTQALQRGETFASWKKRTDQILDREGVSRLNPFRMRTIYDTNIHRAMIEGRDRMARNLVDRGLLRYGMGVSAGDDRVRDSHESYNGQIMEWDDTRWDYLREFNCRCNKMPYFGRM